MVKSVNFLKYGVMKNFRRIPGVDTNHLSSELQICKGIPLSLMKGINSMEMERTILWVIERNLLQVQVEPEIFPSLVFLPYKRDKLLSTAQNIKKETRADADEKTSVMIYLFLNPKAFITQSILKLENSCTWKKELVIGESKRF